MANAAIALLLTLPPLAEIPRDPVWYFQPPWPESEENIFWALEEASEAGRCVEICWYLDGKPQGCSPMENVETGMTVCKEKMARTEGFEMAIELFMEHMNSRAKALEEDHRLLLADRPAALISMRDRKKLDELRARVNEIGHLLDTFGRMIEQTPQEVRPEQD